MDTSPKQKKALGRRAAVRQVWVCVFAPAQQAGYLVSEISFNLSLDLKSMYV